MVGITRPGEASFRSGNRTSLPAAWVTAQVAYLRKIRKRPTMRKAEDVDVPVNQLGIKRSPAAGPEFKRACLRQSEDIIVNGLLAAFRTKAWVLAEGWSVSLGTVGVERLWRNLQRMARNKARSRASVQTVNLVLLFRWCRSVHARLLAEGHGVDSDCLWRNAYFHEQYGLAWGRLSACLLGGSMAPEEYPLSVAGASQESAIREGGIGRVYEAFREARFLSRPSANSG